MKGAFIAATVLGACALAGGCKNETAGPATAAAAGKPLFDVEKRREWAAQLAADGLNDQALAIYEDILRDGSGLSEKQVIGISMTIADMRIKAARYEDALASLYRAKIFAPDGETARKIEEKRILCFERLGRSSTADRLLAKATDMSKSGGDSAAGADVLAEVNGEKVTRADVDKIAASLPEDMRERAKSKEEKAELLRSIVARRVLVAKAKKLALDQDEKVRLAMEQASEQILVAKVVTDEVRAKVKVAPEDVKLYFEAHKDRFKKPAELELQEIVVADEKAEKEVRAALEKGAAFAEVAAERSIAEDTKKDGGKIKDRVIEGRFHPAFVSVADVFAAVGDTPKEKVAAKAVVTASGRHIVRVIDRVAGEEKPFDQVKDDVERALRAEREQAAFKDMLDQALASDGVKLYPEKL